jgi:hypothetical protein
MEKRIVVPNGSELARELKRYLALKREIEAELANGNTDVYRKKGLKLFNPLSRSGKS